MRYISPKGIVIRVIAALLLIIISILPAITRGLSSAGNAGSVILPLLLVLGMMILRWIALSILFVFINAIGSWLVNVVLGKEYNNEDEKRAAQEHVVEIAFSVSFIILIAYQFISTWQIIPGTLDAILAFVFPTLTL